MILEYSKHLGKQYLRFWLKPFGLIEENDDGEFRIYDTWLSAILFSLATGLPISAFVAFLCKFLNLV